MNCPDFIEGNYNTHFIEKNKSFLEEKDICKGDCKAIAIIAAFIDYHNRIEKAQQNISTGNTSSSWKLSNRKKSMFKI